MKNLPRLMVVVSVLGFLTTPVLAQQPNMASATQLVNGVNGPPYPIGVSLPMGVPATLRLQGNPGAPFIAFAAAGVSTFGFSVLGGEIVDLEPATLAIVADGTRVPAFALDNTGLFTAPFVPTSPGVTVGAMTALQTMIANPAAPFGASLTAATMATVVPGVTRMVLSLGDDSSQNVSLAPFNFSLPFYTQTYTSFFVGSNGFVTFNSQSTDYTPTPTEFLSQMPRISMFWCDLNPGAGGTVAVEIDESTPFQQVRVLFTNVPEYGQGGSHTFSCSMDALGNVSITQDPFNSGPTTYTLMLGISPGTNLSSVTTAQDVSTLTGSNALTTNVNDAVYEWFGTASSANWPTPSMPNPFDMTGRTMACSPIGPGQYSVTTF